MNLGFCTQPFPPVHSTHHIAWGREHMEKNTRRKSSRKYSTVYIMKLVNLFNPSYNPKYVYPMTFSISFKHGNTFFLKWIKPSNKPAGMNLEGYSNLIHDIDNFSRSTWSLSHEKLELSFTPCVRSWDWKVQVCRLSMETATGNLIAELGSVGAWESYEYDTSC